MRGGQTRALVAVNGALEEAADGATSGQTVAFRACSCWFRLPFKSTLPGASRAGAGAGADRSGVAEALSS